MTQEKIDRINELYKKKKNNTITEEELIEQDALRKEYVALVRKNMRGTIENTVVQRPDGTTVPLKDSGKK